MGCTDRIQRLKDARTEATKDIEELKAQKNQEYQNFIAEVKEHGCRMRRMTDSVYL